MTFTNEREARIATGLSYLGNINSSAKMIKNQKVSGNYTYVLYLAAYNKSGYNVCVFSTPECRLGCLATSGRAGMDITSGRNVIENSRVKKTKLLHEDQDFFMDWMIAEIKRFQLKAKKDGYDFSIRLNGTSDIDWATIQRNDKNIFELFPEVQFYDYTKDAAKVFNNRLPNYHLTYSYTGRNNVVVDSILKHGGNVAIVFDTTKNAKLPKTWKGHNVIDGDITDFRLDDGKGVVVGLRWKRIANKEVEQSILNSVFVVKTTDINCQF